MKYIQDKVVDDVVAKNATLQDVVQGRTLMLWRPGTAGTVAAQGCLMFGGIGLTGSLLWMSEPTFDHFKCFFFGGLLPLASVTAGLFHAVVRSWPRARAASYRFAIAMTALSASATVTSLLR